MLSYIYKYAAADASSQPEGGIARLVSVFPSTPKGCTLKFDYVLYGLDNPTLELYADKTNKLWPLTDTTIDHSNNRFTRVEGIEIPEGIIVVVSVTHNVSSKSLNL